MRTTKRVALAAMVFSLGIAEVAHAIIGRPLTPMSYAGVARRTARRTAYVGGAAYGAAAVGTAAAMSTLPPGCAVGMPCGGYVYRPVYQGPNVVYVHE